MLSEPCWRRAPSVRARGKLGSSRFRDGRRRGRRQDEGHLLRPFTADSFVVTLAESAIFQRYEGRRRTWVDIDPPFALVRAVLSNDGKWIFPKVAGVIMTPTLRPDGSLIDAPGYDPSTELYLSGTLQLPPIPPQPTRDEAFDALAMLKDLFSEFPFKTALDCSVAVAALLSALLRGSMPTAPIVLVTATNRAPARASSSTRSPRSSPGGAAPPRFQGELGKRQRRSSAPSCSAAPKYVA